MNINQLVVQCKSQGLIEECLDELIEDELICCFPLERKTLHSKLKLLSELWGLEDDEMEIVHSRLMDEGVIRPHTF